MTVPQDHPVPRYAEQSEPRTQTGRTLERIVRNAMPAADGVRDFILRIEDEARTLDTVRLTRAIDEALSAMDDEWLTDELAAAAARLYAADQQ